MRFNSFNDKQNYLRITIAKWEIKTLQIGRYAKTQNKKTQHVIKRQPLSHPRPCPPEKKNKQRRDERVLPNRHISKHPAIIWMGAQPQKESSPCRFCTEAPLLTSPLRKMERPADCRNGCWHMPFVGNVDWNSTCSLAQQAHLRSTSQKH